MLLYVLPTFVLTHSKDLEGIAISITCLHHLVTWFCSVLLQVAAFCFLPSPAVAFLSKSVESRNGRETGEMTLSCGVKIPSFMKG